MIGARIPINLLGTPFGVRYSVRPRPRLTALLIIITWAIPHLFAPFLSAQTASPTPAELDQLLAPVALYPDSLLSQITTASTNPQEILDVDNWLTQNSGLTGTALTDAAQQQGFDPAFIALVNFPGVLEMMAQHIDDYAAIGQAFTADQDAPDNTLLEIGMSDLGKHKLSSKKQGDKIKTALYAGQNMA